MPFIENISVSCDETGQFMPGPLFSSHSEATRVAEKAGWYVTAHECLSPRGYEKRYGPRQGGIMARKSCDILGLEKGEYYTVTDVQPFSDRITIEVPTNHRLHDADYPYVQWGGEYFGPEKSPVVMIESPYSGDVEANEDYARTALWDSLERGEAPIATHLLWTQVWDDTCEKTRSTALSRCRTLRNRVDNVVFYVDLGFSDGMKRALAECIEDDLSYEFRSGYV